MVSKIKSPIRKQVKGPITPTQVLMYLKIKLILTATSHRRQVMVIMSLRTNLQMCKRLYLTRLMKMTPLFLALLS